MNCKAIQDFVYNGHMVYVGSVIDIPDIEIPLYREYLDCSVSGTGKDPKIEDPTP